MTCAPFRSRAPRPLQPAPTLAAPETFNLLSLTMQPLFFGRSLHNGSVIAIPMLSSTVFANFHRLPPVPGHRERIERALSPILLVSLLLILFSGVASSHTPSL